MQNKLKKSQQQIIQNIVSEVQQDFHNRQQERKTFEAQWRLNSNFLMGNQYCSINALNEVEDYEKQYFWQEREVFNHIAPLYESRFAKLSRVRPKMKVIPTSTQENDIKIAKMSKDIIQSVYQKLNLNRVVQEVTKWSEICGTGFYKIMWNNNSGRVIAKDNLNNPIYEGEIQVVAVPPYEIFPESSSCADVQDCSSIIHAKAYNVQTIKNIWGVDVTPQNVDVFSLDNSQVVGGLGYTGAVTKVVNSIKPNHAIVIEKYEAPTLKYPNGRLIIVCQDKLLYLDELPFQNAADSKRAFPFVRQISNEQAGCFWGVSMIERIIPVQRSYNAVKNRKHEFLNRLSMGILTVEDGSVDTNNLEIEGLSPGKVLVYRQGSNPPAIMTNSSVPADFTTEEQRLLDEFSEISGVSEIMRNNSLNSNSISGIALQLMIEQDDSRLNATADNIKFAVCDVAKHILRLYKQFATTPRLGRLSNDEGGVDLFYFINNDISSEDITFETENEIGETLAQKRSMIFELLNAGLLNDEDGKMSNSTRHKVLELLGFGIWENSVDLKALQIKFADKENLSLISNPKSVEVTEIDDHNLHINEHIGFMLTKEFEEYLHKTPAIKDKFINHIRMHKTYLTQGESNGK